MIRLLIVDDEYYIRLGIKNAIDWKSIGIEIVGEAEDGEQGLAMALELEPDLLLMDIRMPFWMVWNYWKKSHPVIWTAVSLYLAAMMNLSTLRGLLSTVFWITCSSQSIK